MCTQVCTCVKIELIFHGDLGGAMPLYRVFSPHVCWSQSTRIKYRLGHQVVTNSRTKLLELVWNKTKHVPVCRRWSRDGHSGIAPAACWRTPSWSPQTAAGMTRIPRDQKTRQDSFNVISKIRHKTNRRPTGGHTEPNRELVLAKKESGRTVQRPVWNGQKVTREPVVHMKYLTGPDRWPTWVRHKRIETRSPGCTHGNIW